MWLVRDKDGKLKLFAKVKPWRDYDCSDEEQHWITDEPTNTECLLDSSLFPELKWEDEPIEVEIVPKGIEIDYLGIGAILPFAEEIWEERKKEN